MKIIGDKLRTNRVPSRSEEIANSLSHGVGFVAAAIAVPALILSAIHGGDVALVVSVSIFGAVTLLLYLTSTIYHALHPGPAKKIFQLLDHAAIFLMIAGSYTPFTVGLLGGGWGYGLLGAVWTLALAGIAMKVLVGTRLPALSVGLYLAMGWLAVVAIKPLSETLPGGALVWIAAGGLAYTIGVFFFAAERVRYAHFVWHLFVISGSTCHFVAAFYVL